MRHSRLQCTGRAAARPPVPQLAADVQPARRPGPPRSPTGPHRARRVPHQPLTPPRRGKRGGGGAAPRPENRRWLPRMRGQPRWLGGRLAPGPQPRCDRDAMLVQRAAHGDCHWKAAAMERRWRAGEGGAGRGGQRLDSAWHFQFATLAETREAAACASRSMQRKTGTICSHPRFSVPASAGKA